MMEGWSGRKSGPSPPTTGWATSGQQPEGGDERSDTMATMMGSVPVYHGPDMSGMPVYDGNLVRFGETVWRVNGPRLVSTAVPGASLALVTIGTINLLRID